MSMPRSEQVPIKAPRLSRELHLFLRKDDLVQQYFRRLHFQYGEEEDSVLGNSKFSLRVLSELFKLPSSSGPGNAYPFILDGHSFVVFLVPY